MGIFCPTMFRSMESGAVGCVVSWITISRPSSVETSHRKEMRRVSVATGYDKLGANYLAFVQQRHYNCSDALLSPRHSTP
jgi:hypothetical protein